jgi:predicted ATPase
MTFDDILAQVLDLLQRQGRVSYRALKRRFDLDDEYDEACQLLAEIYDWFTEGFDTADLQEAKALLEELVRDG